MTALGVRGEPCDQYVMQPQVKEDTVTPQQICASVREPKMTIGANSALPL